MTVIPRAGVWVEFGSMKKLTLRTECHSLRRSVD